MGKSKKQSLTEVACTFVIAIVVVLVFGFNFVSMAKVYWSKGSGIHANSKSPRLW